MAEERAGAGDGPGGPNPNRTGAGGGVAEQARELKQSAEEEVEWRKREGIVRMGSVSVALESAADSLDEQGEKWLAGQARSAAGQVDRLTTYLKDHDAPGLMRDLRDTARSHPASFLGGTFAAGLALGRFLRAREGGDGGRRPGETAEDVGTSGARRAAPRDGGWDDGSTRRTRESGRWSGRPPERMDEARPGVRTGGIAMAGQAAGSGREPASGSTQADRSAGSDERQRSRGRDPIEEAGDRATE